MQPSGQRYSKYGETGKKPQIEQFGKEKSGGRSIAPQYIEDIIASSPGIVAPGGEIIHTSGSLNVILNQIGAVVSVVPKKTP